MFRYKYAVLKDLWQNEANIIEFIRDRMLFIAIQSEQVILNSMA